MARLRSISQSQAIAMINALLRRAGAAPLDAGDAGPVVYGKGYEERLAREAAAKAARAQELAARQEKYGTTYSHLIKKMEGQGQFRSPGEFSALLSSNPKRLIGELLAQTKRRQPKVKGGPIRGTFSQFGSLSETPQEARAAALLELVRSAPMGRAATVRDYASRIGSYRSAALEHGVMATVANVEEQIARRELDPGTGSLIIQDLRRRQYDPEQTVDYRLPEGMLPIDRASAAAIRDFETAQAVAVEKERQAELERKRRASEPGFLRRRLRELREFFASGAELTPAPTPAPLAPTPTPTPTPVRATPSASPTATPFDFANLNVHKLFKRYGYTD